MSTTIAELVAKLRADSSDFNQGITKARDELGRFVKTSKDAASDVDHSLKSVNDSSQSTGLSMGGLARTAAAAFAGLQIGSFVKDAVFGFNSLQQGAEMAFGSMMKDASQAKGFMQDLATFAKTTPFEFPDLIQSAQRFMALGFEAKDVIPILTDVGDAVAAMGGSSEVLDGVIRAMGQIKMKGKVQAEEINQLAERGIPGWEMLAEKIGTDVPGAMEMARKGAINADTAIAALREGMHKRFGGMMDEQSRTFSGVMSNLKDGAVQAIAQGFRPLFDWVTNTGLKLANWFNSGDMLEWGKKVSGVLQSVMDFLGDIGSSVNRVAQSFGGWGAVFDGLKPLIVGVAAGFAAMKLAALPGLISKVALAFKGLAAIVMANPIALAIGVAAAAVYMLWQHSEGFRDFVMSAWGAIKGVFSDVAAGVQAFVDIFKSGSDEVSSSGLVGFFETLGVMARNAFDAIMAGVGPVVDAIGDMVGRFSTLIGPLKDFAGQVADTIGDMFGSIDTGGVMSGITSAFDGVVEVVDKITGPVLSAFSEIGGGIRAFVSAFVDGGNEITSSGFAGALERIGAMARDLFDVFVSQGQAFISFVTGTLIPVGGQIVSGLAAPIINAFNAIKDNVVPILVDAFGRIVDIVSPVIEWLTDKWGEVSEILSSPAVSEALGHVASVFTMLAGIASNVFSEIAKVVSWAYDSVIKPVFEFIKSAVMSVMPVLEDLWGVVKNVFGFIVNLINGDWGKAWDSLKSAVWDALKAVWHALGSIGTIVTSALGGLGKILWNLATGAFGLLWDGMSWVFDKVWGFLKNVPSKVWGFLSGMGKKLWSIGSDAIGSLWDGLTSATSAVWDFFSSMPGKVWDFLSALPGKLWDAALAAIDSFSNALYDGAKAVWDFFTELPDKIVSMVANAGMWLTTTGVDLLTGLWDGIVTGAQLVWDWLKALPGTVWGYVRNGATWLVDTGKKMLSGLWSGIVTGAQLVWDWFKALPGKIWGWVTGAATWLVDTGKSILSGLWNGIKSLADGGWEFFKSLPGKVKGWVSGAASWLYDVGKDILRGMWDGLQSMGDWLKRKLMALIKAIVPDPVEGLLGIKSPSRLFAYYGRMTMLGLAEGLDKNQGAVAQSMGKLKSLVDSVDISKQVGIELNSDAVRFNGAGVEERSAARSIMSSTNHQVSTNTVVNVDMSLVVSPTADKAAIGREVVDALRAFVRVNGPISGVKLSGV